MRQQGLKVQPCRLSSCGWFSRAGSAGSANSASSAVPVQQSRRFSRAGSAVRVVIAPSCEEEELCILWSKP